MGKTPVALGSKVPACPTLLISKIFFNHESTWWDVGPEGLSRFIIPLLINSFTLNSFGDFP